MQPQGVRVDEDEFRAIIEEAILADMEREIEEAAQRALSRLRDLDRAPREGAAPPAA